MPYRYGSPPDEPYDYKCFIRHLAPHLPENDKVFFHEDLLNWRANHDAIPLALFRSICHWKSPRPFRRLCKRPKQVNEQWQKALSRLGAPPFQDEAIEQALKELTVLSGVGERTASALLTAWNPHEFAIMDERVFAVLGMQETHKSYTAADYVEFRTRLLALKDELPELGGCSLRQIELALWHFYAVQETDERDRPD